MSLAVAYTRAQVGVEAPEVVVEVHLANGMPYLAIVGLPEAAVKESKDRVRGALQNSQFEFPLRRITINLAPADLPKEGGRFDLPIALGILAASGQVPIKALREFEFLGELALSGELRPVRGVLPAALQARNAGRTLVVPHANAGEAALVTGTRVVAATHLLEVCAHLNGVRALPLVDATHSVRIDDDLDLADVRGQPHAKRALEIAASGGHSLLMIGPPGTGKTMLASRLPGILPPMTEDEAVETAAIHSISDQGFNPRAWRKRPFRNPHHTASGVALVGGGSQPRPGEISLAHNGVMFLDELPEFDRRVLEVLREPLESARIVISRAARQAEFPARFQLIAAMNPCPCGYLGDPNGRCHCTAEQIHRYRTRLSGPLLDRIDLQIEVPRPPKEALRTTASDGETSAQVRARVMATRDRQLERQGKPNAHLNNRELTRVAPLHDRDHALLEHAIERFRLSPRAYHRILRLARTVADIAGEDRVETKHLTEALTYRAYDKGAP